MFNKNIGRDESDEFILKSSPKELKEKFAHVGFACQAAEAKDKEVYNMIDDVIY